MVERWKHRLKPALLEPGEAPGQCRSHQRRGQGGGEQLLCEKTLERMLGQASERSNVGKEVGLQKLLQKVTAAMKLKDACSLKGNL